MSTLRSRFLPALLLFLTLPIETQIAAAAPLSQEPNRVLYQIYLQSFQDGALQDGEGDFAGMEQRLSYLKDLGISGVLVMPIFEGSGGMGYIPRDFYRVRRDYGGSDDASAREQAFVHLVNSAHALGIKIFLDTPINHIGTDSKWFQDSEHRVSGFEDWFRWSDQPNPAYKLPWDPKSTANDVFWFDTVRQQYYYGIFSRGMPDLNHENPAVQSEMIRFFSYWASLGVDGFRIDAAKHLVEGKTNANPVEPANLALLKHYLSSLREKFPDQSFLLEAWSNQYQEFEPYLPESGDVVFDFAYMETIRDSVAHSHPWAVRNSLKHMETVQNKIAPGNRIVFSGNHDVARIRTLYGNSRGKVEVSMALSLFLPWTPLIYYGDEIFMPGAYLRSNNQNIVEVGTPMAWTSADNAGFTDPNFKLGNAWNKKIHADFRNFNVESELKDPTSLLRFVKAVIQARNALPIDNQTLISVDNTDSSDVVLQYSMQFSDKTCAEVFINFSDTSARQIEPPHSSTGCAAHVGDVVFSRRAGISSRPVEGGDTGNNKADPMIILGPQAIWVGHKR